MTTHQPLSACRDAAVHVGDIVEARSQGPLMFVQEVGAGAARCAWIDLHGVREEVFPLRSLRRAPAPTDS